MTSSRAVEGMERSPWRPVAAPLPSARAPCPPQPRNREPRRQLPAQGQAPSRLAQTIHQPGETRGLRGAVSAVAGGNFSYRLLVNFCAVRSPRGESF